ncbi:helix-turn-helix domain-containing protein [Rhodococcus fascians]|nr:helix-turn-helix domain-containing protein [Rhodococcus fascians]MBY4237856.1 helix-turn-helix domain-containing protein [Rhodococcus fascians]MBY4253393.1 helix-turn-helix domain-containing protein [Rhodococcus fascians]MBY4269030.1 helix-turn-helix domain-containing protein [Rhodococcus fascians]MBY4275083.1 helix-turn-helix domain-containing protein [Rhodococcus fascians]
MVVPGQSDSWWAWLSWPSTPAESVVNHLTELQIVDLYIGVGEPAAGHDGFRRSHSQAVTARKMAVLRRSELLSVVRYRDVEVAALLCNDPHRALAFSTDRLGSLALGGDANERLRATLRCLFDHGHNRAQTAQALHVHSKTVTYRITQAEELLGRSVNESTLDLEIALTIFDTLGES